MIDRQIDKQIIRQKDRQIDIIMYDHQAQNEMIPSDSYN